MDSRLIRPPSKARQRLFYGYVIVAAAFFIMVVMWAVYYAFGIFFKPILNEFGWTRATTSGAFSLATILNGLLAIAMGGLTDKLGSRTVMTVCGLLLGLGYMMMSQVNAIWQLYLFYGVIVGIGMAGSFVPLLSTVARWFAEKRGTMTGIVTAGIGMGALIGPPVANCLISTYGWRVSYIILGGVVLVGVAASAQILRRDPAQVGQVVYRTSKPEQKDLKAETEELPLGSAIRTRQFWVAFSMFFCVGFCVTTVMVHIAPHSSELGMSAASSANILATIGGLSIIGKVVLGRAVDIIGSRKTFTIGFILMSVALLCVVSFRTAWMLYVFACVFGFAYGGCVASQSPLVALLFGLGSHGLIFGVLTTSFTIGGASGPLLTGYIFDMTYSYELAFLVCGSISLAGIILTAILKPRKIAR